MNTKINKVRIIGGLWRGRKLSFVDSQQLRPTPDRVRETLFNWLSPQIQGAKCLDLYAGSGILGFEAISRGALAVVMVEKDLSQVKQLRANTKLLETSQIKIIKANVLDWLDQKGEAFDIVFMDPPYYKNLLSQTCALLEKNHWLARNALIYLESENDLNATSISEGWKIIKSKTSGQVKYSLGSRK